MPKKPGRGLPTVSQMVKTITARFLGKELPPFIVINLDGSRHSLRFWQRLAELIQKPEYPAARLLPPEPQTCFEIMASVAEERITMAEVRRRLSEARNFFRDLEKLADKFLAEK